jgi:hypothetical protein
MLSNNDRSVRYSLKTSNNSMKNFTQVEIIIEVKVHLFQNQAMQTPIKANPLPIKSPASILNPSKTIALRKITF